MRSTVASLMISTVLLVGLTACGESGNRAEEKIAEDSAAADNFENELVFNDVTLEQLDNEGDVGWIVNAAIARYSKDRKIARVEKPTGELYQNGEVVFKVKAERGEVYQDGRQIFLKDSIVAVDTRDGTVLRGEELEWKPQEDLLIVRKNLTGTHDKADLSAREARFFSQQRRLELQGEVVMKAEEPPLQLRGEKLEWKLDAQQVIAPESIQIDRYEGDKVTDRAVSEQATVNLETKTATLKQNAELTVLDPPLRVNSNELIWDLNAKLITSNVPVSVLHRQEQVRLSGNTGWLDISKKIFYLRENVQAFGGNDNTQLSANQLDWSIPSQEFEARGNVVFRQSDPQMTLNGPQAKGKLEDQTIVISGGRVVTEIIP